MQKPSLPQGTRDFGPETVRKRNYIFQTIRNRFETFGFQPLETPAFENLETLMGKYGEEGDQLIFKILNNGLNNPSKQDKIREDFEKVLQGKNVSSITERAMKYDLTIPFARYVAMNHGQLSFPFKRYQIQPVWRADRPQKGRYREFYQCDADIVGSRSLLNEVELVQLYTNVFEQLRIPVEIRINNRKILAALAEQCGGEQQLVPITIAIDKLDKIGIEKVKAELAQRGLSPEQIETVEQYLSIKGNNQEILTALDALLGNITTGKTGLEELDFLCNYSLLGKKLSVVIDPTLARGLNYYTGTIFEVKALTVQMGSIGGGGRYDDLTGLFGVPNIPGVGISFGVDRIYDVMEELRLFPSEVQTGTQILFFNLGEAESRCAMEQIQQLRARDIRCEIFHENAKFDKQFKYAEKKAIPFVAIIGTQEMQEKQCSLKDLRNGKQVTVSFSELQGFTFE